MPPPTAPPTAPPGDRVRRFAVAARVVGAWIAFASRFDPLAVIVLACAVLAGPLVFFRGYNSDEGLAVSIARTAIEDGQWLVPHVFNMRWIERPTLLSWIIAAVSALFGGVSQVTARLPILLFLLAGCVLIYAVLRRAAASVPASLFGVALFLACPLVIRSYVLITADMPLAVLLFLAFALWWRGTEAGPVGLRRWVAIGFVLALAGLFKGPQPVAYFALGVGLFVLLTRTWRQLPGLVLAGAICVAPLAAWYAAVYVPGDEGSWAAFMRLGSGAPLPGPLRAGPQTLSETLPAALAAAAFLIGNARSGRLSERPRLVLALACYAFTAALVILLWPGGSTPRYYFPMILPLCVLGGLGFDLFRTRRPEFAAPLVVIAAACLGYALVYALLSPLLPHRYQQARIEAGEVTARVRTAPAPIYRLGHTALNTLPYVPGRILSASLAEMAALPGPAWLVVPSEDVAALLARRPDKLHVDLPLGGAGQWRLIRLDP